MPLATTAQIEAPAATPEATLADALAFVGAGQDAEALALLEAALDRAPNHPGLLHAKGAILRRQGLTAAAIATYRSLLAAAPDDPMARPILVLLLREQALTAEPAAAAELLKQAWELSGHDAALIPDILTILYAANQHEEVATLHAQLDGELHDRADLRGVAGLSNAALGRDVEAVALLEPLVETDSTNRPLVEAYATCLLRADPDGGPAQLDALVARHPDSLALLRVASELSLARGDAWAALDGFRRVSALDPADAQAAAGRARILLAMGCVGLAHDILAEHPGVADDALQQEAARRLLEAQARWAAMDRALPSLPGPRGLYTLLYGDVTAEPGTEASDAIAVESFIEQIEYLRARKVSFVAPRDVAAADRGRGTLPERAALLTFMPTTDAMSTIVAPILRQYGIPALAALPTARVGSPYPGTDPDRALTWEQVRSLARDDLVTIGSAGHNLLASVPCNPQGRLAPAAASRIYLSGPGEYETIDAYRNRILEELHRSRTSLMTQGGAHVDMLVWPHGAYNAITMDAGRETDFSTFFAEAPGSESLLSGGIHAQHRVRPDDGLDAFALAFRGWGVRPAPAAGVSFAMPVSLSGCVGETPEATERLLDEMVERVVAAGADTVYLEGYADDDADGSAEAVFFPNDTMPVKVDVLDHAASLLRYRGVRVMIKVPALGWHLPLPASDSRMLAKEYRWGRIAPTPINQRLSPFNPETPKVVAAILQALAASVDCDGIVFANDAYLTDREDMSDAAARVYREKLGLIERNPDRFTPEQRKQLTRLKIEQIEEVLAAAKRGVLAWRPDCVFVRPLFGTVLTEPDAAGWYSQDVEEAYRRHDFVVVDATPEAYVAEDRDAWIKALAQAVHADPGRAARTVFSIGLSPMEGDWLSKGAWVSRVETLCAGGCAGVTFYPDRISTENRPRLSAIKAAAEAARGIAQAGQ